MWPRNEYIILDVDQIRIRYVVHAKFCYQTCWISLKILTGVAFTLWENIWCVPISCWNARNLCVLVTPSVSNFLLSMDVHIWIAFAFWGLIHMPRNIGMISSHDEYSGFSRRFPLIIYHTICPVNLTTIFSFLRKKKQEKKVSIKQEARNSQ
jgi:hypothetical protein